MNTRRVIRYIPVEDGTIVDLKNTAVPGVGRRGSPTTGTYAIGSPETISYGPLNQRIPFSSISGDHIILGFVPAPLNPRARKAYQPHGWLVVLIDEAVARQPTRLTRGALAVAPRRAERRAS